MNASAADAPRAAPRLPPLTLGLSLSIFLALPYVLCVAGYLFLPRLPVEHSALSIVLPGFSLLSWRTFLLGLAESFLWGWYIGLVFAAIHNFVAPRVG